MEKCYKMDKLLMFLHKCYVLHFKKKPPLKCKTWTQVSYCLSECNGSIKRAPWSIQSYKLQQPVQESFISRRTNFPYPFLSLDLTPAYLRELPMKSIRCYPILSKSTAATQKHNTCTAQHSIWNYTCEVYLSHFKHATCVSWWDFTV
jgi:hypothetical protein